MRTLTTETPITPGLDCYTMEMGRVVPVRVLSCMDKCLSENQRFWMGAEYKVRYTGTEKVCLDYGQNWYLNPGDEFVTRKVNMDSALEWIAEKY